MLLLQVNHFLSPACPVICFYPVKIVLTPFTNFPKFFYSSYRLYLTKLLAIDNERIMMKENRLKFFTILSMIVLIFGSFIAINFTIMTVNANTVTTTHSMTVDETNASRVIKILNYNIKDSGSSPEFLDVIKEENAEL